ncbi:MAG TPA: hypothetical protein VFU15_01690 [Bacteroidia bacterium]|nr:hypothetical protein [Bacteroidia bacterium]
MKKNAILFTATLVLAAAFIYACGGKKADHGKWTDQDIDNAKKNCMFGKDPALTDDQQKAICDCWVDKVMAASPDPAEQSKIPMDEVNKMTTDCRASAGVK